MNKNNYYVPDEVLLHLFNKKFLRELGFIVTRFTRSVKYSIESSINKELLMFDDKQMFFCDNYFYFFLEHKKTLEIIFNPFERNEFNCSFLFLTDSINFKLSKFVSEIFKIAIKTKLDINNGIERNSSYAFDKKKKRLKSAFFLCIDSY